MTDNVDLVRGDDSQAFGQNLIRITLSDPDNLLDGHSISKCVIRFNESVTKTFLNPVFPLLVNLTSEESSNLTDGDNTARMAIWDENNQKLTAEGGQIINIGKRRV